MKKSCLRLAATFSAFALTFGLVTTAAAHDHHGHWHRPHFGVYLGAPVFPLYPPPYYYNPPVYYGPPALVIREVPPVYVERGSSGYWYYCDRPAGYYPYVKECLGVWRAVAPEPER
jgi:hypothetical protein